MKGLLRNPWLYLSVGSALLLIVVLGLGGSVYKTARQMQALSAGSTPPEVIHLSNLICGVGGPSCPGGRMVSALRGCATAMCDLERCTTSEECTNARMEKESLCGEDGVREITQLCAGEIPGEGPGGGGDPPDPPPSDVCNILWTDGSTFNAFEVGLCIIGSWL